MSEENYNSLNDEEDKNFLSQFTNIKNSLEDILDNKELDDKSKLLSITNVFNSIKIPFISKKISNEFFLLLEYLRKNSKLEMFLKLFINCKLKNKMLINILKLSFFKLLNVLSQIKEEYSLNIIKFIIFHFIYNLTLKDDNKLINFFSMKLKYNKDYIPFIINSISKTSNIYNIYICGLILNINIENKNEMNKYFTNFYISLLDDENRDNNLIKTRLLNKFLKNLDKNILLEIFKNIDNLINRSIKNYKFLENIFIFGNLNYENEVLDLIFKNYFDYFFPSENITNNSGINNLKSFEYIVKNCNDKNYLINKIINIKFDVDKKILYRFSFKYISSILKYSNKIKNKILSQSILFILNNFIDSFNENFKSLFENIFNELCETLFSINIDDENNNIENNDKEYEKNIFDILNNIINNNNLTNFFNYMYLIGIISIFKLKFDLNNINKDFVDNLKKNLKSFNNEINLKSINFILPLTSLLILINNDNNNINKDLLYTIENLINSEIFYKNFNDLQNFDLCCLNLIIENYLNENTIKLLSYLIFKKKNSSSELKTFENLINKIINDEKLSKTLIEKIFLFILKINEKNIQEHISFIRISLYLKLVSNKYFDILEKKDFLKFLILYHIPNMYYDANMNNKKRHNKNEFIENFYKNHSDKILNKIEENIDLISKYLFSNYGIFSENILLMNSSYEIIKKIFKLSKNNIILIKDSFGKFNIKYFEYIDNLIKYYNKNIDLLKKFELVNLVKTLKNNEIKYNNTINFNLIEEKKEEKEEVNIKENNNMKSNKGKNKKKDNKQKNKDNKQKNKEKEKEKEEDLIVNVEENKTYLNQFIYKLSYNLIFILRRLKPIIFILNNLDLPNSKENIKIVLEVLWILYSYSFCKNEIMDLLKSFFKKNILTKNFSKEFIILMYLESKKDNDEFKQSFEDNMNIISKFNSKVLDLFKDNEKNKNNLEIFKYFDFVIIRILFYILLNKEIEIEDYKDISVDNLILILKNLNSLNYDSISNLLINLLKSDYTGNNMSELLSLYFKNASEKNFLLLCNYLLEYEYISKYSFLKTVFELDMKIIKNYEDFNEKIFIIIFDENEELNNYALKIWNKFNLTINKNFYDNHNFNIAFIEHKENETVNRAIKAYVHIENDLCENILKKYMDYYEKEINQVNEKIKNKNEKSNNEEEDEEEENSENLDNIKLRKNLFYFIDESIELISSEKKKEILDFLMKVSDKEVDDKIFELINNTIFNIINNIPEKEIIENILSSIEKNISNIKEKKIDEINYNNLKIILMMLNSILVRTLHDNKFNEKKSQLFDTLYKFSKKIKNKEILYLLYRNIEYISSDIEETSKKLFENILKYISELSSELVNFGEIYTLSGLIKCFGIKTYKSYNLDKYIINLISKDSTVLQKQSGMYIISILFDCLKKLYEPYFVEIFSVISDLISNKDNKVRDTAKTCFKDMMKNISGFGVEKIMPNLIKDLHEMNWKGKVANIEILGQFAFCAPKQLSVYIPKVIKEIMIVLKDPHPKVQEIADKVLNDIATTITNPEIVQISDLLIKAIENPFENSKNALDALMETTFSHYLDPSSIALIIPIIDYNLKGQNDELKKKASHVIGAISIILQNNNDMISYSDIIIPDLKLALFDGNPSCRNAIAKTVGALIHILGLSYLNDMLSWITDFLEKESETVQRSGAAQAYAEILVNFGENIMEKYLKKIINKIKEGNYIIKEGYLSLFVFLPGCLGDKFEKYFKDIFALIIESFSDEHEIVRNVSNKIFEICIKLYAKKNTKQLIEPLINKLFNQNWRIRNSSIALIKTLINSLNNEFSKENSEYFSKELRDKILCYTFILEADYIGNTSTIANIIWRDYVDNKPKYISKILLNLYDKLIELLNNKEIMETFEIAKCCVKLLSSKYYDKLFGELFPIIRQRILEKKDDEIIVESSFLIIYFSIKDISQKLILNNKEKVMKIINENLFTEFESVRNRIAEIVNTITKNLNDKNINRNLVYNVMKQARNKDYENQKKILEIVAHLVDISEGEIINYAIGEIFKKPFEEGFLELGSMISESISKFYNDVVEIKNLYLNLYETFFVFPFHSIETIVSITEKINEENLILFKEFLIKLKTRIESKNYEEREKDKDSKKSYEYYLSDLIKQYCDRTNQDITEIMDDLVKITISLLYFDNKYIVENVGYILKKLVEITEKSSKIDIIIESFLININELEHKLSYNEDEANKILSNKFKIMMDQILFTIQNGLLYGDKKSLSCELVNVIINHSTRENLKPYIMKIIGPIIRILSEKISPEIKEKLMDNSKILIMKSKEDIKGISPQLQSVFLKTLTDISNISNTSERYQIKAGENIIRLLQYYPRADVTANDLLKSIQNKINMRLGINAIFEMEILSDVIKFYGNKIKEKILIQQFNSVKMWLKAHPELPFDSIILLLSSYSQYLPDNIKNTIDFSENEIVENTYKFIEVFNGDVKNFENKREMAFNSIKSIKKDQAIIFLKPLGKIIHKYRYYKEFDTNYVKISELYESEVENIFLNTDLLNASNEIHDGNLCIFLLSLGYMKSYDANKKLKEKVFKFLLQLMESKVNLQVLISCLSLIVLKEIQPSPDIDDIMNKIEDITDDENERNIVDKFLKKVYYLYDK